MELLLLLLLSPAIFAHRYGKINDPNDEPFLPIYPVYPYSPKLIKRGTERESATQLTAELYAPKPDAKDSYSTNYNNNYSQDPYYPNYVAYQKTSPATSYSSYYSHNPYSYSTIPYNVYNSYASPYTVPPPYSSVGYSSGAYPGYYYQPPYYYPSYYSQPLLSPPPPPPMSVNGNSDSTDSYSDSQTTEKTEEKKFGGDQKIRENNLNQETGNQFAENGNYLGNSKDLDSQPSTYKVASPYNQLEQGNDLQVKSLPLPLPKTTYRVVSVAGQPVGPDYPLPTSYAKAQHLEQLMRQTLANLLNQQQEQQQQVAQYSAYSINQNVEGKPNGPTVVNENYNKPPQTYVQLPGIFTKTGLAYAVNPTVLQKVNVGQTNGQILQAPAIFGAKKYSPLTGVTLDHSQGLFVPSEKPEKDQGIQPTAYGGYDNRSSQHYEGQNANKQEQDRYENDQGSAISYQKQNFVTVQTPQTYSYQYSSYSPKTTPQQQEQYKTNLEDVNFGAKQTNKG